MEDVLFFLLFVFLFVMLCPLHCILMSVRVIRDGGFCSAVQWGVIMTHPSLLCSDGILKHTS